MTIYVEIFLVCEGIFMTYVTHDDSEEYYDLNETRYDNLKSRASQLLRNYKDEGFTIPADPVPGTYYNQDTTYEFDAIKGSLDKIESDLRVRKAGKLADAALIGDEAEVKRLLDSGVKLTDPLPNDPKFSSYVDVMAYYEHYMAVMHQPTTEKGAVVVPFDVMAVIGDVIGK